MTMAKVQEISQSERTWLEPDACIMSANILGESKSYGQANTVGLENPVPPTGGGEMVLI